MADGDCDDGDPAVYPGAPEQCNGLDDNCDGNVPVEELDGDGDGHRPCDGDCNDHEAAIYPGAAEVCDHLDNDCDGALGPDEIDDDGDGLDECDGDCDDTNPDVRPGRPEICDGLDDNCDGQLPPGESDLDGDGFMGCADDCNDASSSVYPGAPELCNGQDEDCDGAPGADEVDADGDGWMVCEGDCDDGAVEVHPNMPELCMDGLDNDCDQLVDLDDTDCAGWIDPALICGPDPDLSAGTPPFALTTGEADVEVAGLQHDGWYWFGCQAVYHVAQLGMLDCGTLWELEGWSTWVDPATSSYEMLIDLYVIHDTCGTAFDVSVEYRVSDVSGNWTLFEIEVYDPFSFSWILLDPAAPGELIWAPNGTHGWGWIEYASDAWP